MAIKAKQIRILLQDYLKAFPEWQALTDYSLARATGPIMQGITLYRSHGSDKYIPTGYIRVLTAPTVVGTMELPQRLLLPNRAERWITLKSHPRVIDEVIEALRRQIVPSLQQPLVPSQVLQLYMHEALPTVSEAYSLATLNAYFGFDTQAREFCVRYRELADRLRPYWGTSVYEELGFLSTLEIWLNTGTAREHLAEVLQAERVKCGLQP